MQWDEKKLDTQFTPNVYFWTPNSEILAKALEAGWIISKTYMYAMPTINCMYIVLYCGDMLVPLGISGLQVWYWITGEHCKVEAAVVQSQPLWTNYV